MACEADQCVLEQRFHRVLGRWSIVLCLGFWFALPLGAEVSSLDPERAVLEARVQQILQKDNVSQRREIDDVFALADLYASEENTTEAVRLYEAGLRVDSWRFAYQLKLARLLHQLGDTAAAIEKTQTAYLYAEDEDLINEAHVFLSELGIAHSDERDIGEAELGLLGEIVLVPIGKVNSRLLAESRQELEAKVGLRFSIADDRLEPGEMDRRYLDQYLTKVVQHIQSTLSQEQLHTLFSAQQLSEVELEVPGAKRRFAEQFLEQMALPQQVQAFHEQLQRLEDQGQFDVGRLISDLKERFPMVDEEPTGMNIKGYLGVTEADIFSEETNFVFGTVERPYGVMSYHRFLARTNDEPPNRPRLRARFVKQALSSAFFILGIPRCTSPMCARAYPHSLTEHDQKGTELCLWCKEQLRAQTGHR